MLGATMRPMGSGLRFFDSQEDCEKSLKSENLRIEGLTPNLFLTPSLFACNVRARIAILPRKSRVHSNCCGLNSDCCSLNGPGNRLNAKCCSLNGLESRLNKNYCSLNGQKDLLNGNCCRLDGQERLLNGDCCSLNGRESRINTLASSVNRREGVLRLWC